VDTSEPTGMTGDEGPTPVYGLDIETDTTIDGLDPAVSPVVLAALSTPDGDEVFDGDEADLLAALDARLRTLPPGVLATWNGAVFDLPFVADRAGAAGVPLGLALVPDPTVVLSRGPLRGHTGAYRATWYAHRHIDSYRMYRGDVGRVLRISCSLKAIARVVGLTPVEVDRERIHELPREVLDAYVASDARLARVLTERRRSNFARFVDLPPLPDSTDVSRPRTLTVIPQQ
jgi:DNA polymerase elongation subunit (family B)